MLFIYLDIHAPYSVVGFEVVFQFIPRVLNYKLDGLGLRHVISFLTYEGDPGNSVISL
jgi:hypothetical protein